jgi:hypothetical protein
LLGAGAGVGWRLVEAGGGWWRLVEAGGCRWMQMDAVARKIKWQKFYFILYLC